MGYWSLKFAPKHFKILVRISEENFPLSTPCLSMVSISCLVNALLLNSSSIDELGRWCLKVGWAGQCTAGKELSMVTLKRSPPTWAPSHWRTQNTYQHITKLLDLPKGGWAGRKLRSLRANVLAKWACEWYWAAHYVCWSQGSPARVLGHPKLYAASGSGLLHIGVTKCPCKPPRVQASLLHLKAAGEHCFDVNFA